MLPVSATAITRAARIESERVKPNGEMACFLRVLGQDYVQIAAPCLPKLRRHRYNAPSPVPRSLLCCMLSGEFDGSDRDYFFQIGGGTS